MSFVTFGISRNEQAPTIQSVAGPTAIVAQETVLVVVDGTSITATNGGQNVAIGKVATAEICRRRGDTYPFTVQFTDSSGTAIDITGFTYLLTVDPSEAPSSNTNNLFQNTPTVTDGPNGTVTVELSSTDADQQPGEYFFDIQQTDSSGRIRTVLTGQWNITQDITK